MIEFLSAFGLGVAAVAAVFYVFFWEVSLHLTDFAFVDAYNDALTAVYEAKGLASRDLAAKVKKLESMMASYRSNPAYRMPIKFVEIFPIGFVVALISAALLRNPKVFPARA